ncbi:unnamed protein product [Echinostoma caproni]|uniref:LAM_G_DOMAIN domain-containing protein n=1 Tax=Echinostoma caproni TaxID=27848 RepID=A0A183APP9_9TREM|nr:unnamed protein product [Echinostoma caproni]
MGRSARLSLILTLSRNVMLPIKPIDRTGWLEWFISFGPRGFSGQYCEHLFSISLPSAHSYIAIVPPSRGALVPRGTISLKVSTHSTFGILIYYADLVKTGKHELPEQYLLVDLDLGYVRVMFSLTKDLPLIRKRSEFKVNDGHAHVIQLHVERSNLTLLVDQLVQKDLHPADSGVHQSIGTTIGLKENRTTARHLALTNPLYFGGAPADRLEAAGRILRQDSVLGMTGCIQDVQINERPIDLARLFGAPVDKMTGAEENHSERPAEAKQHGTAIGILPGCYTKPIALSATVSKLNSNRAVDGSDAVERIQHTLECVNPKVCLNGGTCVRLGADTTHYR